MNTTPLLEDHEIPDRLQVDGKTAVVLDRMRNYHTRVLVLPTLSSPRWLSNDECRAAINQTTGGAS